MRDSILGSPEPVAIVALGPLTNVTLLLRQFPDVQQNLRGVLFVGGAASGGNATAAAEFNVWHNPGATAIVPDSDVDLWMYGLDVFNQVTVDEQSAIALQASAVPATASSAACYSTGSPGTTSRRLTAACWATRAPCARSFGPDAIAWEHRPVHVELHG